VLTLSFQLWLHAGRPAVAAIAQVGIRLLHGIPVIVDATHARRAWRLVLTQALQLPVPVIQEMAAALADPHFGPARADGSRR